jgi:hypothetical protein
MQPTHVIVDTTDGHVWWNHAGAMLTEVTATEVAGRFNRRLSPPRPRYQVFQLVPAAVQTWTASAVTLGWHMAGVGIVDQVTTRQDGQVTFSGPDGDRTFPGTDTLVEAIKPA